MAYTLSVSAVYAEAPREEGRKVHQTHNLINLDLKAAAARRRQSRDATSIEVESLMLRGSVKSVDYFYFMKLDKMIIFEAHSCNSVGVYKRVVVRWSFTQIFLS